MTTELDTDFIKWTVQENNPAEIKSSGISRARLIEIVRNNLTTILVMYAIYTCCPANVKDRESTIEAIVGGLLA